MARVLWVLLALSAVATAKPLPQGMKVTLVKNRVIVSQNGVSVPLNILYEVKKLTSAELTDDGKSLAIKTDQCEGMFGDGEEPELFPFAPIQARLANSQGMAAHKKKKYADAITQFTAAVQADPQPVYITNLLSAQAMSGKLDDADATLTTHGKKLAPWMVWRLAVDRELKKLVDRAPAKLAAEKPGTAKAAKLRQAIAVSPLGFAATEVVADGPAEGMGGDTDYEVVFVELASGKEVLRLPSTTECDTSGMTTSAAEGKKCVKKQAPLTVARRKVVDAILAKLGFELVANAFRDANQDDVKTPEGKAFDAKTAPEGVWELYFIPKFTVFVSRSKQLTDCVGMGMMHMTVSAAPRS